MTTARADLRAGLWEQRRAVAAEPIAVAAVAALAAAFYVWVRAGIFNNPAYIDPWIYTGFFINFDFLYESYDSTYYASRLPWIIPGRFVHALLPAEAGFLVLHVAFMLAAALAAYLLVRRLLGRPAAFVAYIALLANLLFYTAYVSDYPDGAVITYLLVGAYFALSAEGSRRRALRMGAGGFFLAAAVGTNLFAGFFVAGLVLAYVIAHRAGGLLRSILRDVQPFALGVVALLLTCGIYSKAEGGEFFFFMPSVRQLGAIENDSYRQPGLEWIWLEPRVFVPPLLLLAFALLWRRAWWRQTRADPMLAAALGLVGFLVFTLLAGLWIQSKGALFEISYYFSIYVVAMVPVVGVIAHAVFRLVDARARLAAVVAGAIAATLPTLLVYKLRWLDLLGHDGAIITIASAAVALGAIAALRVRAVRARAVGGVAVAAVALIVFATNVAGATSRSTYGMFATDPSTYGIRADTLGVADEFVDFMERNRLHDRPTWFWYDHAENVAANAVNSLYLWGYTAVSFGMPTVDKQMREVLELHRPYRLILLCSEPSCEGGPGALDRAGYEVKEERHATISSGSASLFVRVLRLPEFRDDVYDRFYAQLQSPFTRDLAGQPVRAWSFARGLPPSLELLDTAKLRPRSDGLHVATSKGMWDYEIGTPVLRLKPGNYRVLLRGNVARGGLMLGVLDVAANGWAGQTYYWFRQTGFESGAMATSFRLTKPKNVRIVLTNAVPQPLSSRWILRDLKLVRVGR